MRRSTPAHGQVPKPDWEVVEPRPGRIKEITFVVLQCEETDVLLLTTEDIERPRILALVPHQATSSSSGGCA